MIRVQDSALAVERLPVSLILICGDVDLEGCPLFRVQRLSGHLSELIFTVVAVVRQQDTRVVAFDLLLYHAVVNPEIVDSRPPRVLLIAAPLIPAAAVERHAPSLPDDQRNVRVMPDYGMAVASTTGSLCEPPAHVIADKPGVLGHRYRDPRLSQAWAFEKVVPGSPED